MKRAVLVISGILAVGMGMWFVFLLGCEDDWCYVFRWQKIRAADGFERCATLGFPVMESSPRQCRAGDKIFTEALKPIATDMIRVAAPLPNALVTSPLTVRGEVRGNWYFEASFPVRLYDANGTELTALPAQAKSNWMTTEFVPFEVELVFSSPATETGILIFEKDNPSGLPEYADAVSMPVRFR